MSLSVNAMQTLMVIRRWTSPAGAAGPSDPVRVGPPTAINALHQLDSYDGTLDSSSNAALFDNFDQAVTTLDAKLRTHT